MSTTSWNVVLTFDIRDEDTDHDDALERLAPFHAALSSDLRGRTTVHLTLPADSAAQATFTACAVGQVVLNAEVLAVEVMTTVESDAREGWEIIPELLTVTEVADRLGVSRQAVLQRISSGSLPAQRVGNGWVIPAEAVTRAA